MPTNLPDKRDDLPAFAGQAALFADPDSLLVMEPALLRELATTVGRSGGSVLAQVRRAAGLVAWAGWHRFNAKDYEAFVAGLASDLGVEVQTLRKWRSVVVAGENLAVPAVAEVKKRPQKRRSEGVRDTAVSSNSAPSRPNKVIQAASSEAPDQSSEGAGQDGETRPASPSAVPSDPSLEGSDSSPLADHPAREERGDAGTAHRADPSDNFAVPPTAPTGTATMLLANVRLRGDDYGDLANANADDLRDALRLAADELNRRDEEAMALTVRQLIERLIDTLADLPALDLWKQSTEDEKTMVADYINELREVKAATPAKRSPGRVIRPEDRAVKVVPEPVTDPSVCSHPAAKVKKLPYGRFCDACKTKVA